jgi:hypothetical protein
MPDTQPAVESKASWEARAARVGLDANATDSAVIAEEKKLGVGIPGASIRVKDMPTNTEALNDLRNEWVDRCLNCGLDSSATQDEVVAAEGTQSKLSSPIPGVAVKNQPVVNQPSKRVQRARALNLLDNASDAQILAEETRLGLPRSASPVTALSRRQAVGLNASASEAELVAAEKEKGIDFRLNLPRGDQRPALKLSPLAIRARGVGLPDNATLSQVEAAENK